MNRGCQELVYSSNENRFMTRRESTIGCAECPELSSCTCDKEFKPNDSRFIEKRIVERREVRYDQTKGTVTKLYEEIDCCNDRAIVAVSIPTYFGPHCPMEESVLTDELRTVYDNAMSLANQCKHKMISEVAILISLWMSEREILELFFGYLEYDYNQLMTKMSDLFNGEQLVLDSGEYVGNPWYQHCHEDIELANHLMKQMCLSETNAVSILWSFVKQKNIVGVEILRIKPISDTDIRNAFIKAVSKHMDLHVVNTEEKYLWPLYQCQID